MKCLGLSIGFLIFAKEPKETIRGPKELTKYEKPTPG
jgi:hypothetical protein